MICTFDDEDVVGDVNDDEDADDVVNEDEDATLRMSKDGLWLRIGLGFSQFFDESSAIFILGAGEIFIQKGKCIS